MWHQKATTEKPIVAIESKNQKPFAGFEQLILSFDDLKEVIENDTDYELWHAAMSSVNAVYLIVDTRTGNRYVGSTYGYDGLLGRWSVYVSTGGHGNNKGVESAILKICGPQLSRFAVFCSASFVKIAFGSSDHRCRNALEEKAADLRAVWHEPQLSVL